MKHCSLGSTGIALAMLGLLTAAPASADTLYVNASLTTGFDNGRSWENAYRGPLGLQAAIATAVPGDEIYVTGGTYYPGPVGSPPTTSFVLEDGIEIYGGFLGGEPNPGHRPQQGGAVTRLCGDLARDDSLPGGGTSDNSRHVVVDGPNGCTGQLDRVAIECGFADTISSFDEARGAGLHITHPQTTMLVKDCWFLENRAQYGGGGAAIEAGSPRIVDCIFFDNTSLSLGGGAYCSSTVPVLFDRCRFLDNFANFGGGLLVTSDSPTIARNSVFARNVGNSDLGGGGVGVFGVHSLDVGPLRVEHCTVVDNQAPNGRTAGVATHRGVAEVYNSILWNNVDASGLTDFTSQLGTGNPPPVFSIVEGSLNLGSMIDADPMFMDGPGGDFRPAPGSPAIDAGDDSLLPPEASGDCNGQRRRVNDPATAGTMIDIGAFEFAAGAVGTVFCLALPNSTGQPGKIDAYGSRARAANNLTLIATQLPPGEFGIFIVSRDARFLPGTNAPNLCLSASIGRFSGPGQILLADANGSFSLQVDLNSIPVGGANYAAQAGQSWSFQAWHRDPGSNSWGLNLTDGTTVVFE